MEEEIEKMCQDLKCILHPSSCIYATDRYLNDCDCLGPITVNDLVHSFGNKQKPSTQGE